MGSRSLIDPRDSTTVSTGSLVSDRDGRWRAPVPRRPERVEVAGALRRGVERELDRRDVDLAGHGRSARLDRRRRAAERDHRHGPFVHLVGTDERRHGGIGEPSEEGRGDARRIGERQELGEHRAGVPVHVPVPPLPVAPARPPRDPGDDHRRHAARRRRSDLHERVVLGVVPVHAGGQLRPLGHGDVELQREPAARRPCRPEQPRRVRTHAGPRHTGGQVEQTGELREVEHARRDVRGPREDGDGRRRRRRQLAGERDPGQLLCVPLVEPGQPVGVVHDEVVHHAGVVDRRFPDTVRIARVVGVVGRQSVQRLARRFHDGALSHRSGGTRRRPSGARGIHVTFGTVADSIRER